MTREVQDFHDLRNIFFPIIPHCAIIKQNMEHVGSLLLICLLSCSFLWKQIPAHSWLCHIFITCAQWFMAPDCSFEFCLPPFLI